MTYSTVRKITLPHVSLLTQVEAYVRQLGGAVGEAGEAPARRSLSGDEAVRFRRLTGHTYGHGEACPGCAVLPDACLRCGAALEPDAGMVCVREGCR